MIVGEGARLAVLSVAVLLSLVALLASYILARDKRHKYDVIRLHAAPSLVLARA
jgi:hypothetical protein